MYKYRKSGAALAVGALFAAPAAFAQDGTVQIYGKLYPQFASFKSSGATASGTTGLATLVPAPTAADANNHAQRYSVDANNSYVGFRGEEKLGGSLSAIWQMEQATNFDTGDSAFWANRNSFVGLRSGFGTVKLGNMDTIYKEYGDQFSMFGLNSGNFTSASNTLSHIGLGVNRLARFHERAPNSVQYEAPSFGNFTAGIQFSPDEQKGNPGETRNRKLWSYGVKYEGGPIYASVHQEKHYDFFGGSNNVATAFVNNDAAGLAAGGHSVDTATRFSGAFKLGTDHQFTVDVARLEYTESGQRSAGRFDSYKRVNWAVGWEARWGGPFRTGIQYVRMNKGTCTLSGGVGCDTAGLNGNHLSLGTAYDFSKRTFVFALYSQLTNGPSARFDNWPNGDAARGADTKQFAVGVQHRF
jgi:major outer membrane protein P.IB